ncbi:thiosulfate sulfurtransferase PspE precursor [Mariprofundus micogutta]|uniref:Thiosulfate sulfurtransferase PspE n=1 Tax=Mariprofundus micogutta TaxID=1921010 RepID=A0A1L8CNK8_9PROT|nr:rhodanese-like domain-containing protein [Mariprofundus micogutta]GAV20484.1 thiosulfate sulfurtransferase PspE precursor [Mariprofundus micogutta]
MNQSASGFLLIGLFSLLCACTLFESSAEKVSQQQLLERMAAQEEMLILDVRTPGEYSEGYIGNAINIDHREIEERLAEITAFKNKPVIVYCYSGMRAGMVEAKLIEHGFTQVQHLDGDWSAWQDAGLASTKPK